MKQEEKSRQSLEKILRAAAEEFGKKGYDGASLNTLLSENGLSKGLVYHYFDNKDKIYLACVKRCFDTLAEELSEIRAEESEELLQKYFAARGRFFATQPQWHRIFIDALLQPPIHLRAEVAEARKAFEEVNHMLFLTALRGLELRAGVLETEVVQHFTLMQSVFHLGFLLSEKEDGTDMPEAFEARARRSIELLLYGLVRRREE